MDGSLRNRTRHTRYEGRENAQIDHKRPVGEVKGKPVLGWTINANYIVKEINQNSMFRVFKLLCHQHQLIHAFLRAQADILKLLVLFNHHSKTQRYSV